MKCATRKLRSFAKWHGGKTYLARRIIELFPDHKTYVEPFVGGGSILLNKKPAPAEIVNDLNVDLIRVYMALRDYPNAVIEMLKRTRYEEESFKSACYDIAHNLGKSDIDDSVDFIIRNRMSRGGLGKDFAWSDRLRGGQPGDVNAWQTMVADLPLVVERLKKVTINSGRATTVIEEWDSVDTLFYCDPPYLHETHATKKAYDHEMTREDHEQLLALLQGVKGKVFLSGYRSALYDAALADWKRREFSIANHSGQGATKQRRIECVWENHV